MYAHTSRWFVSRTRATLRSAEFGFLGVCVATRTQTPRRSRELLEVGDFDLLREGFRPLRTSCWTVGIRLPREGTARA